MYSDGEMSGVKIFFSASINDATGNISISGNHSLTADEYRGNEALDKLEGIVRAKLIERLQLNTEEVK